MNKLSPARKYISIVLKTVVFLSAVIGTLLSAYAGRHSFMGGSRVFMFFTIQSNIAVALISLIGCCLLLKNKSISNAWAVIKFVGTVSITLTGMVFAFVLAPTFWASAWNIQNTLTHVIVPLAAIIDFFVVSPAFEIKNRNTVWVIVPPILYAIYAGIGFVRGWEFIEGINYPYFFLNWGSPAGAFGFSKELPFMGCAWWILALLLFLLCVGRLYLAIAAGIRKRAQKRG